MNDVNPIFKHALAVIGGEDDRSAGAVEGGIVIHPTLGPGFEAKEFDEYDDDLMHDVCGGPRLAKPIQALLITYRQIKLSHASFGEEFTNNKAALEALMPLLAALRKAVREQWQEDL